MIFWTIKTDGEPGSDVNIYVFSLLDSDTAVESDILFENPDIINIDFDEIDFVGPTVKIDFKNTPTRKMYYLSFRQ